jgi:hypothetical protein
MPATRLSLTLGLALGALAAAAAPAAAQAHAGHGAGHGAAPATQPATQPATGWTGDLPKHFEGIALTDAQKARIVALQKDHHARMDRLRDSARAAGAPTTGNAALDAKVEAVRSAEHAAFRALLDDAGRKRFDENMARMHAAEGHGTGHGTGHGAGHGAQGRPPRR